MKRLQRSRADGAKLPPNTLCVTRGTMFGNPFKKHYANEGNQRVVDLFREWIFSPEQKALRNSFIERCKSDGIEHVACWCNGIDACHADVWIEVWEKYGNVTEQLAKGQES